MKWCKDPKVEHLLRSLGIKYETATVKIAEIDRQLSADKQVRLGKKINDDWVLQYAQAGQDGAVFPMPVLNKLKRGWFIWSGNHRTAAAELNGDETLDAYAVEVHDQRLADILPRVVNAIEAQGVMGRDERLVNARYFVEHHSMAVEDAAKVMQLKYEHLLVYLRAQQTADRIAAQGVSPNGLTKSTLTDLSPIQNANVLRETTRLLQREGVVGRESEQLIMDVKKAPTELGAMAELARWENLFKERRARAKAGKAVPVVRSQVRSQLINLLQRLDKLVSGPPRLDTLGKLQLLDQADQSLVRSAWASINASLSVVVLAGKPDHARKGGAA